MIATRKISRNAPCPCGSGRKFKRCCLRIDRRASQSLAVVRHKPPASPTLPSLSRRIEPRCTASQRAVRWNEVTLDAPLPNGGRLHTVVLFSDGELSRHPLRIGDVITLNLPNLGCRSAATVVDIRATAATAAVEAEALRVVRFRSDDDVGTALYGDWTPPRALVQRWAAKRRVVVLKLEHPDGGCCDIELLRTVDWLAEVGARVGGRVFLDLPEMGARGWAEVRDISPCPTIENGAGAPITGRFRHSQGRVGALRLESESEPIAVTGSHLFWSADRQSWVAADQLQPDEILHTAKGTTKVISYTLTNRVEPVYNIEVEGDHVYRVGESGVLVHNQSPNQITSSTNAFAVSSRGWRCRVKGAQLAPRASKTRAILHYKEDGLVKAPEEFISTGPSPQDHAEAEIEGFLVQKRRQGKQVEVISLDIERRPCEPTCQLKVDQFPTCAGFDINYIALPGGEPGNHNGRFFSYISNLVPAYGQIGLPIWPDECD